MTTESFPTDASKSGSPVVTGGRSLSGRQIEKLRESLLAYAFLFPALVIIGLFGLFPLVFALYQSVRGGLNKINGPYRGFDNYTKSLDSLAYVVAFGVAIALAYYGITALIKAAQTAKESQENLISFALPGALIAAGVAMLFRWLFELLPLLLTIPELLRRIPDEERTTAFRGFALEALREPPVRQSWWLAIAFVVIGFLVFRYVASQRRTSPRVQSYLGAFVSVTLCLLIAAALSWFTYTQVQVAYAEALEDGETIALWAQIITIMAGFVLLFVAWQLWKSANHRDSNASMVWRLVAAMVLIVGAWILIGELPRVIAEGDKDWWQGLRTTAYYSIGTIPFQLSLALFVSVMLFQDIKGKTLYRILYFLPYITPTVAAAGVFRIFFASSEQSPINTIWAGIFQLDPLKWLDEPGALFWSNGPSLALIVLIIFGVWKYMGFSVVIFLAGLGNIPKELYDAASIDGAGRWPQFRNITLPLLSPTMYFLVLWTTIGTFKAFNTIWVMRSNAALGTTDTASVVIFSAMRESVRYGYASSLGIVLLIIILMLTYVNTKLAEDKVHYG